MTYKLSISAQDISLTKEGILLMKFSKDTRNERKTRRHHYGLSFVPQLMTLHLQDINLKIIISFGSSLQSVLAAGV